MGVWTVPGYTESRELGAGGGGRVVLAVHDATGVPVAVKYLGERLRGDGAFVRAFRAEAQLLGALDSPYVVRLHEYVEAPAGAAIVMELVEGTALRALLAREGATGPEAALTVLKGSLLGLAAAHGQGVVHRDYKPENVLVAADGSSKLVDFGIAARDGATPGAAGTPAYMAPEQWRGGPASPAADVYAATAVFYECLTGRKPYGGGNMAELALQHLDAPVPAEAAPEPVRTLVRRGLAKDPGERPADAAAFVAELETVAAGAYGADWEERGQRRLAALAALAPLLLRPSGGGPAGADDRATTALGGGAAPGAGAGLAAWLTPPLRRALAGVVALAVAAVLALAVRADEDGRATTAQVVATTSAGPAGPEGSAPPVSASPGPSPTGSGPSAEASADASPSPGVSGTPGTVTPGVSPVPTESGTPTAPVPGGPSAEPPTSAPPSPAPESVAVTSVAVTGFRQTGPWESAATVEVATDGPGPVTVVVAWYTGDAAGNLGAPDGTEVFERSGATRYTLPLTHTVQGKGCRWGVRASTEPAAAGGAAERQFVVRRGCPVG
ncbi:protein kinase [Streptomyces sp. NPDC005805]|uniref:protein kinase domain-containing protein n=1 Tax=Streptomyces sp. NPDC005805 TaxID=3157068 RepID=UPI0033CF9E69